MSQRSLWLTAYDIADPKRLRSVASICEDVGRRIQHSVFLCHTPRARRRAFRAEIDAVLHPVADRVIVIPICSRCQHSIEQHGSSMVLPGETPTLVV